MGRQIFLNRTQKVLTIKKNIYIIYVLNLIKIKRSFCSSKDTIKKLRKQVKLQREKRYSQYIALIKGSNLEYIQNSFKRKDTLQLKINGQKT